MSSKIKQLDTIRAIAATYVVIGHWGGDLTKNTNYQIFFKFGQEAVIAFFMLSGFVIYLSFQKFPEISFKTYFIKRFRRIYFPVFCAYIISGIVYYSFSNSLDLNSFQIIGNLLMLQDFGAAKPGNWVDPLFNNGPLWSLSYEWWFYMLFFPIMKFYKRMEKESSIYHVLVISCISWIIYLIFPNHGSLVLSYFVIWWVGVEAAKIYSRSSKFSFQNTLSINISIILLIILSIITIVINQVNIGSLGVFPLLMIRHFTSALVLFNIGLLWYKYNLKGFSRLKVFNWVAPMSYALYVIHRPLLKLELTTVFIFDFILKLILIISLSYLIEVILQPRFNKIFHHILK